MRRAAATWLAAASLQAPGCVADPRRLRRENLDDARMRTVIPVVDGSPLTAIQGFLGQLIRAGVVEAVLVPMVTSAGTVTPALVADPDLLASADPLAPVMGLNSAPIVGHVSASPPRGRIAVVLRSCEMRALIELVKLRQADLADLLTVGIDCLGTYDVPTYLAVWQGLRADREGEGVIITSAKTGTLSPPPGHDLRDACRMCEKSQASGADIVIELFGADLSTGVPVSLPDEVAAKIGMPAKEAAEDGSGSRRADTIARIVGERTAVRDARFTAIDERLASEGIEGVLAACIRCHNCMTACPACYCRTCLFCSPAFEHEPMQYMSWAERKGACRLPADTMMFHLTRLNHMALSCVGCGMCTSACPSDLPVGEVFRSIGRRLQSMFEYEPGRDETESLPLITFREDEWMEMGEE